MQIQPIFKKTQKPSPSFGYRSILKKEFLRGKIPIEYGFYGDKLTKDTVTLEHIVPHSKGGKSTLSNYVLSSMNNNHRRSNRPLADYINWDWANKYFEVMEKIKTKRFDGKKYVSDIKKTIQYALSNGL
jgi:hypothetical protein